MGIISRILRICRADAHGLLDRIEDKGRLLRQYLREMEISLDQKAQQLRKLEKRRDQLSKVILHREKRIGQLKKDLHLAIKKDRDDIARVLIRKRLCSETDTHDLKEQLADMDRKKSALSQTLTEQRIRYASVKAKTDTDVRSEADDLFQRTITKIDSLAGANMPGKEEIELELLRTKEKLFAGDTP